MTGRCRAAQEERQRRGDVAAPAGAWVCAASGTSAVTSRHRRCRGDVAAPAGAWVVPRPGRPRLQAGTVGAGGTWRRLPARGLCRVRDVRGYKPAPSVPGGRGGACRRVVAPRPGRPGLQAGTVGAGGTWRRLPARGCAASGTSAVTSRHRWCREAAAPGGAWLRRVRDVRGYEPAPSAPGGRWRRLAARGCAASGTSAVTSRHRRCRLARFRWRVV